MLTKPVLQAQQQQNHYKALLKLQQIKQQQLQQDKISQQQAKQCMLKLRLILTS
jgi:hypothetical protein